MEQKEIRPISDFFIDYSHLDDFQRKLIDARIGKDMIVSGSAGSGKSLIALHKAKQIANMGASFAIIVFTRSLHKYFADGLNELNIGNDKVFTYYSWQRPRRQVDYLIVDECQDFSEDEINNMKNSAKYCLFFGDTAQSIMGFKDSGTQSVEDTAHGMGISPQPLYFNYRLTKQNARLAEKVGHQDELMLCCKNVGQKPSLLKAPTFEGQLDLIAQRIQNQNLTNVGILLPHNTSDKGQRSVQYVKDYLLNKGITCEFKYNANQATEMDLNFHSSNPKIMTWWCAKGLQFKDVFIPGCEQLTTDDKLPALYVAITRSRERLYLAYSRQLASCFPPENSDVYQQTSQDFFV